MTWFYGRVDNEEGSVIIISVLVLVVLSIVGFSASRISTTEMQIVRNEGTYLQNFHLAEAAATEAAQRLWNTNNRTALAEQTPVWLNNINDMEADGDMQIDTPLNGWFDSGGANPTANVSNISPTNNVEYSAVELGMSRVIPGSLGINSTAVYEYAVVGVSDRNARGQIVIEIGYRKRY